MALVDTKAFWLPRSFVAPLVTPVLWVPVSWLVVHTHFLHLHRVLGPWRHAPQLLTVLGRDEQLDDAVVRDWGLSLGESRYGEVKFGKVVSGADVAGLVPVVEVTYHCYIFGIGDPFTHLDTGRERSVQYIILLLLQNMCSAIQPFYTIFIHLYYYCDTWPDRN